MRLYTVLRVNVIWLYIDRVSKASQVERIYIVDTYASTYLCSITWRSWDMRIFTMIVQLRLREAIFYKLQPDRTAPPPPSAPLPQTWSWRKTTFCSTLKTMAITSASVLRRTSYDVGPGRLKTPFRLFNWLKLRLKCISRTQGSSSNSPL